MASILRQNGDNYFSKEKIPEQSITTYREDEPYTGPALLNSDSSNSTLPSPTSPLASSFPQAYTVSKTSTFKFDPDFDTCDGWMCWEDPSDAALSPTPELFSDFKAEPGSPSMSGLDLQGNGIGDISIQDSAVFVDDNNTDIPFFQTPNSLITPPLDISEAGLYSTPLSWSRPSFGRLDSEIYTLSPQEESALRNIAMPASPVKSTYPASPSSSSSPEPCPSNRKRKPSVEDDDEEDSQSPPSTRGPIKKTAHNMIEKRYRTNLNEKIAALRDSVPSLRVMSKKSSSGEEQEDLQGLTPAHKLNKATVLSKATEYIAHLEKRNKHLLRDNKSLKDRVDAFEQLVRSRQGPQQTAVLKPLQQRIPSISRLPQPQISRYSLDGYGPI